MVSRRSLGQGGRPFARHPGSGSYHSPSIFRFHHPKLEVHGGRPPSLVIYVTEPGGGRLQALRFPLVIESNNLLFLTNVSEDTLPRVISWDSQGTLSR